LGRLAVPPEYRGRGIAHHLVAAVEAEACQRGFSTVRLGVRITLEENRAMFLHLGFQEISAEKHPGYSSPTFLVMEKAVDC
jgi:ribosomal protein S18 acetylase RimI-like enzyme